LAGRGPASLCRGVVIAGGADVPEPWAAAPVVRIDDAVLADPEAAVAVLHRCWSEREAVVVQLAVDPARFRAPWSHAAEPWTVDPGFEPWGDRLRLLVWANTYDARAGEPVWWWARKAARLGAVESPAGPADVLLADDTPAWVDGGPRGPVDGVNAVDGARVVHRESVELGRLASPPSANGAGNGKATALAPDQLAAVTHGAGPARVIAPAGSGKTRVLTERLRHLLGDRGIEPALVLAVAYNRKARDEMADRTTGLGARVETLNALGYGIVTRAWGRRPPLLEAREQRALVESLVPSRPRRANVDPIAVYIDGLSLIRLGLRDPAEVEAELDGAEGLAAAFDPYRAEMRRREVIDYDEQVYLAIELLLGDGEFRRDRQAEHRHLLVDELQDLTPAHVLLLRLLSAPGYDVFGVGDDDQVIYGHAGADPRFLIDYRGYFPCAREHALEVNYRCPAPVVDAARSLLAYNVRRVDKQIRSAPDAEVDPSALRISVHAPDRGAGALVEVVREWLAAPGAEAHDIAVLTRVRSLLLAPHVALAAAGVPVASILEPDVLDRVGLRAALAYLRIAVTPTAVRGADLVEVQRRPSRALPPWIDKWLSRCRDVAAVAAAADRIDDRGVAEKLRLLHADLERLANIADEGTTRDVLTAVRDDIGLGRAMTLLDGGRGGDGSSHLDDLEGLLQVADLHADPAGFEPWLRRTFHHEVAAGGVELSTIHRVKGREWPCVVVFGVTEGLMPHRLSVDVEEERRVLHVAITRGRHKVAVLADSSRPSPFLAELDGSAPRGRVLRAVPSAPAPAARTSPAAGAPAAAVGVVDALKRWRRDRSRADGVPAYVVLSDKHLEGIAARLPATRAELAGCPGIGPARLETYGVDILEVIASAS